MKKNAKFIILVIISFVLIAGTNYWTYITFKDSNESSEEQEKIIENDGTVVISTQQGIDYVDWDDSEQVVEIETVYFDFDSEYAELLNVKYDLKEQEVLDYNYYYTQEFIDAAELENAEKKLAGTGDLEFDYVEYDTVGSLLVTTCKVLTEGSGECWISSENINLSTGNKYTNLELLELFSITEDDFIEILSNDETWYEAYQEKAVIRSNNIESYVLYINSDNQLMLGFDYYFSTNSLLVADAK